MRPLTGLGREVLGLLRELGGLSMLALGCLRAPFTRAMEWRETLRQCAHFGVDSVPVLAATAALVGGILVVQAGLYVRQFGVQELVGWLAGFGVLREVGPLVAGLVFSGRVGSRNAAEIAAMSTRDQIEGLRAIGVDAVPTVIAPRALAMAVSLTLLYFVCAAVAIGTAMVSARGLLGVEFSQFQRSFIERTQIEDLLVGVAKSMSFAFAVALISCRAGQAAKGGAAAVGDAAKRAVVRSAFAIVALDFGVARLF